MAEPFPQHFLQYFFTDLRALGDQPLLFEKHGAVFRHTTRKEAAGRMTGFARALDAAGLAPGDRVAFHATASAELWISEWGVLANRGVAVVVPHDFAVQEIADTLGESRSRIVIVDTLAEAHAIADASHGLRDLTDIVCFDGGAQTTPPTRSWNAFMDSGRLRPDRSTALLRSIAAKDTAMLFYYRDEAGLRQAVRYTHSLLLEHARKIDAMLGKETPIHKGDMVLASTVWEDIIGHIACCYVPLLKEASIHITSEVPDISLFENRPQVVIGRAAYFDGIRRHITEQMRQSGQIEWRMFMKALARSKSKYESEKKPGLLLGLQDKALQATIVKKVLKLLGGRLRLLIGVDDAAPYNVQLFFHTFGIELVEMPSAIFSHT